VLFAATSGTQHQLWASDGTPAGTFLVATLAAIHSPAVWSNGLLFFQGNDSSGAGDELWKSDLTAAGTAMVKDVVPGGRSSNVGSILDLNGVALFMAEYRGPFGEVFCCDLWRSDGTEAGTYRLAGSSGLSSHAVIGNQVF